MFHEAEQLSISMSWEQHCSFSPELYRSFVSSKSPVLSDPLENEDGVVPLTDTLDDFSEASKSEPSGKAGLSPSPSFRSPQVAVDPVPLPEMPFYIERYTSFLSQCDLSGIFAILFKALEDLVVDYEFKSSHNRIAAMVFPNNNAVSVEINLYSYSKKPPQVLVETHRLWGCQFGFRSWYQIFLKACKDIVLRPFLPRCPRTSPSIRPLSKHDSSHLKFSQQENQNSELAPPTLQRERSYSRIPLDLEPPSLSRSGSRSKLIVDGLNNLDIVDCPADKFFSISKQSNVTEETLGAFLVMLNSECVDVQRAGARALVALSACQLIHQKLLKFFTKSLSDDVGKTESLLTGIVKGLLSSDAELSRSAAILLQNFFQKNKKLDIAFDENGKFSDAKDWKGKGLTNDDIISILFHDGRVIPAAIKVLQRPSSLATRDAKRIVANILAEFINSHGDLDSVKALDRFARRDYDGDNRLKDSVRTAIGRIKCS